MAPTKSKGGMTEISSQMDFRISLVDKDKEGRFILVQATIEDQPISLLNIYAPNANQKDFFLKVIKHLEQHEFSKQ